MRLAEVAPARDLGAWQTDDHHGKVVAPAGVHAGELVHAGAERVEATRVEHLRRPHDDAPRELEGPDDQHRPGARRIPPLPVVRVVVERRRRGMCERGEIAGRVHERVAHRGFERRAVVDLVGQRARGEQRLEPVDRARTFVGGPAVEVEDRVAVQPLLGELDPARQLGLGRDLDLDAARAFVDGPRDACPPRVLALRGQRPIVAAELPDAHALAHVERAVPRLAI